MCYRLDLHNSYITGDTQARTEALFKIHMTEQMEKQHAINYGPRPSVQISSPQPFYNPPVGGGGVIYYHPVDFEPLWNVVSFPFFLVAHLACLAWEHRKVVGALAAIGLLGFGLYAGWQAFTAHLARNNHYVYGHASTRSINGHHRQVDLIDADQLIDHSATGHIRSWLGIPTKFQFVRSVIVQGDVQNAKLYGPGFIQIEGNVDHSIVISPSSPVLIGGALLGDSAVYGYGVTVNGTQSAESGVQSALK